MFAHHHLSMIYGQKDTEIHPSSDFFQPAGCFCKQPKTIFLTALQERKNLSAELLTNTIYSSILLNSRIYETHEVSLSDGGSLCIHIRRLRWLFPL